MPIATLTRQSNILAVGDSLTGNGGTWLPFFAMLVKVFTAIDRAAGIAANTFRPNVVTQSNDLHSVWQPFPNYPQMQVDGYAGTGIQFLLDNFTTRVLATKPNPTDIFYWLSPNDCGGFTGPQYQAKYDQVIEQTQAGFPGVNIVGLSILCIGEKWDSSTGPGWGPNVQDVNIAILNTAIAASFAAHACPYLDVRALLLAEEQISNTSPVVGTVHGANANVTADGTHPSRSTGERRVAKWIFDACTVVAV
jgi:hypothetical protein